MKNNTKGFILLYRQIVENELYFGEPFDKLHAWIDLLLMAAYEDTTILVRGKPFTLKRGQVLTSVSFLSERWQWSKNKVKRYLGTLSGLSQATADGLPQGTLLTIVKYDDFNVRRQADGPSHGPSDEPSRGPSYGPQDKRNIKNIKEGEKSARTRARAKRGSSQEDLWDEWLRLHQDEDATEGSEVNQNDAS